MTNEEGESLKEHRMEINVIEKTLRDLYYNPESGYQNAEKLFKDIQKYDFGITRKGVKSWLEAQPAYTQHRQLIKNHPKRQTWVNDLGEQLQIDLIFMGIENNKSKWAKENDGYNYIVVSIEVLSRYAFPIPTKKINKEEVTLATETIFEEFHNCFDRYSKFIVSDYGRSKMGGGSLKRCSQERYKNMFSHMFSSISKMADGHVLQGSSPATMRKQLNSSELAESLSTIVQGQGMNISLQEGESTSSVFVEDLVKRLRSGSSDNVVKQVVTEYPANLTRHEGQSSTDSS